MEKNKEELLDAFINKTVKEVGLESPSVDFTDTVLSKIQLASEKNSSFVYQPLISKKVWALIAVLVVAVFVYVIFGEPNIDQNWLAMMKLNNLVKFNLLGKFSGFSVSNTVIYGFLALAFFIWVQVLWITKNASKRYHISKHYFF